MHLSDTSSIAQHLKKIPTPKLILENSYQKHYNIRTTNDKQKLQILKALHIRKKLPKLDRLNFKSSTNILSYCCCL